MKNYLFRACAQAAPTGMKLARRFSPQSVAIVTYHGIVSRAPSVDYCCLLDISEFESLIRFLAQ